MAALTLPVVSTPAAAISELSIPLPGVIFLAVSLYLIVLLFLVLLHQCLQARGCCPSCLGWQKVGELGVCDTCVSCAQSCDCRVPSATQCMDSCCPTKPGCGDCRGLSRCPLCDVACTCQPPDCNLINCFCCEIKLR
ncbi:uncharacterized protein LOC128501210 [Spea bombifrons]|uniref:uncharacterized protein LOC128501210 n=1 Tax=Spea bombifrons TaxID=233779 RepID=UPI00234AB275|nr:uncharacterized protein LOC128501210 [Spea bombifrons]